MAGINIQLRTTKFLEDSVKKTLDDHVISDTMPKKGSMKEKNKVISLTSLKLKILL